MEYLEIKYEKSLKDKSIENYKNIFKQQNYN